MKERVLPPPPKKKKKKKNWALLRVKGDTSCFCLCGLSTAYPRNKRLFKWCRIIDYLKDWRWRAHDMPTTKKKNNASDKQNYLTTNERLYPQRDLMFLLRQNKALTDMISIFYFKIIVDNNHVLSLQLRLIQGSFWMQNDGNLFVNLFFMVFPARAFIAD